MTVVTPAAHIRSTLLRPKRGTPVTVSFAEPVSRVVIGGGRLQRLEAARSVVPLGVRASGRATAGTTTVAAAVRSWETLSKPAHVSWFVPGARRSVVAEPAAGSRVAPLAPLTLTFARPVASVLGSRLPRLEPAMPGHWQQVDSHRLTFRPDRARPRTRRHRARARSRAGHSPGGWREARRCGCRSSSPGSAISRSVGG